MIWGVRIEYEIKIQQKYQKIELLFWYFYKFSDSIKLWMKNLTDWCYAVKVYSKIYYFSNGLPLRYRTLSQKVYYQKHLF